MKWRTMGCALLLWLAGFIFPTAAGADQAPRQCAQPVDAAAKQTMLVDPRMPSLRPLAQGRGIRVAVIDTGVAAHPRLTRVVPAADLFEPDRPDPLRDCDGHGTVVAGIIADREAGYAPEAEILSIRQSSTTADAKGTLASLAKAIDIAVDKGAHVINISLVACVPAADALRLDTRGLDAALDRAEKAQVVVVAAAGNASSQCTADTVVFPAHSNTVIAVSARSDASTIADYSLPPPEYKRQISAAGSLAVGLSTTPPKLATAMTTGSTETSFTGTSFAAPHVSGTAALLKERHPTATAAQIRDALYTTTVPAHHALSPLAAVSATLEAPTTSTRQDITATAPANKNEGGKITADGIIAAQLAIAAVGLSIAGVKKTPGPAPAGSRSSSRPRRSRRK